MKPKSFENPRRQAISEASRTRRHLAPGFGLIELLAAMAIIGVLAALLLPSMESMLRGSEASHCISNLRQIGLAFHLYLQDNDQRLPQRFYPGSNPSIGYDERLLPYLNDNYQVFICPIAKNGRKPLRAGNPTYGMNWYYDNVSVFSVEVPARTLLLAEVAGGSGRGSHRADRDSRPPGQISTSRHNGKSNYLFFDGRVQALDYAHTLQPVDIWGSDHTQHEQPAP